ncbi:MAG: NfeD family protein [Kiritimatiellae bacterium]|nr:NfeD family protein [Kiritimatiellia bacterium]
MDFTTAAWIWLYVGAFLMLAELASPGFVIFFFGLGAATVAGTKWLVPGLSLSWQLALFSIFSVFYLIVLRKWVKNVFLGDTAETQKIASEYVGRVGKVVEAIRPEVPGRIMLGDAEWSASSAVAIAPGAPVKVVAQENLTLVVEPLP